MNLLETKNLTLVKENRPLLNNLSLEIWEGHIHAIIGPNGAGKSTLANTIMGLSGYRDISGDILYRGESIKALSVHERARKGITLLFQEPARFEGLGVRQFILAGALKKSVSVAEEALHKVGLAPERYLKRAVDKTLSGGERKRIELASIYVMKPRLVLMDEPDSGVDIDSVKFIFSVIKELRKEGSTVLLITHSPEVLKHADHAFLICAGTLVDKGEMARMFDYFNGKCVPCVHVGTPESEIQQKSLAAV